MLPPSLVGESHLGGFIAAKWELRIARRCLRDDLGVGEDASFDDVADQEIVRALVKDRFERVVDTRQVAPLTCGREIWVLARGNDHRGATWFDEVHRVVWLLASGVHRSGSPDDFFPFCKGLDANDELLPDRHDYKRLFDDRSLRFAIAVRIEAPLILRQAREEQTEVRCLLGGEYGAGVAVELSEDLEATTIAFKVASLPYDFLSVILEAFHPGTDWDDASAMPSRPLDADEIAFTHLHVSG